MPLTEEQLRLRMQGVGGSEIGAVAGLSPFATPLDVYATKVGERPPLEENHHMRRGRILEPAIAAWWAEETGAEQMREPGTLKSSTHPLVIATPDRAALIQGELAGCEIKAPGQYARGWGAAGTDEVPPYILAQAHWEMHVLGLSNIDVAALIEDDFARYPVAFDGEFFGMLVEAAERFWKDHVEARRPPDAQAADSELLKRMLPRASRPKMDFGALDLGAQQLVTLLLQARTDYREAGERHDALVNRLKQLMGEHEGLSTPWGRIDWKHQKDTRATDWKSAFQEVRNLFALYASVDGSRAQLLGELDTIEKKFTTTRPGQRPFVVRVQESA